MLWTLAKVVAFLAAIAALAFGASHLAESAGSIRLWAFDHEFTLTPLVALIALVVLVAVIWVGLKLLGLLGAVLRFLNGDETAISRYFDRSRERRGYQALSEGMVALASGEHVTAMARARTAERLLKKPELTLLLTAQAAEAAGDTRIATNAWKGLLSDERTRFVAVRGLLRQKLAQGDTATALKLAERAFALRPKHAETQDLLLKLQAGGGDWAGARETLAQKHRTGQLPRAVYRRRDALLALQEAKVVLDEGATIEAREAAIEANRLSPDLIPAAVIAARALVEQGERKGAARVLRKAWEAQPHPDLARAFAEIEPDEDAEARLKRFQLLFKARPEHEESRLTEAELRLATEDFKAAKAALGDLPNEHPTQRSLAILAAAERGLGRPDDELREILTRALAAPRGRQWCCENCAMVHAQWAPICSSCSGFDTLVWAEPDPEHAAAAPGDAGELAPLILDVARKAAPAPVEIAAPELIEAEEAVVVAAVVPDAPVAGPERPPAPVATDVPPRAEKRPAPVDVETPEDWAALSPDEILRRQGG